jgi:antitoxin CcdA
MRTPYGDMLCLYRYETGLEDVMTTSRKLSVQTQQASPRRSNSAGLQRKSTNITLRVDLVEEAKALGVNLSQAAEVGVADAVARKRAEKWLAENQEALDSSNAFVEQHGLPLARYRNF